MAAGRTGLGTAGRAHGRALETRRDRRRAERRALQARRRAAVAGAVVLALAIATVTVGFTARDSAVARERASASAQETAQETAREMTREMTLARRAQAASASRLTSAATAYATATRVEALASAAAAEAESADVQRAGATVLAADALAPLVDARQGLAALMDGLSTRTRTVGVVTVAFIVQDAPVTEDGTDDRAPSRGRPVGPLLDSTASSVSRSSDVLQAARDLTIVTEQVRAATSDAIADLSRRAADATRSAAADLARRVAVAAAAPNGRIPPDALCGVTFSPDAQLRCDAAAALDRLDSAFRAARGGHLVVVSSYRDLADQVAVKASRGDLASTPGASNHGRGIAVDLAGLGAVDDFAEPAYLWLKAHAQAYGWSHPAAMEPGGDGPLEPWHWEFDGSGTR
ncbi:MAG TPA: M15 family metallopeptidase [Cellulomonadaceae bacterium]|nr:M15 family metallopeptidase [Cellulomonadaceae bacterium]